MLDESKAWTGTVEELHEWMGTLPPVERVKMIGSIGKAEQTDEVHLELGLLYFEAMQDLLGNDST